jgi:hypothetical protein
VTDLRSRYEAAVGELEEKTSGMLVAGIDEEQVACWAVHHRGLLKLKYRELTPRDALAVIEAWTFKRYGNCLGPTVDQLRARGKSWADIIHCAARRGRQPDGL